MKGLLCGVHIVSSTKFRWHILEIALHSICYCLCGRGFGRWRFHIKFICLFGGFVERGYPANRICIRNSDSGQHVCFLPWFNWGYWACTIQLQWDTRCLVVLYAMYEGSETTFNFLRDSVMGMKKRCTWKFHKILPYILGDVE